MSFRFAGMAFLANSESHSSKMEAAKLGTRLGDNWRADCRQPFKAKINKHSEGIENFLIMAQ